MNKVQMLILKDILYEYDNQLVISDLELVVQGNIVTDVVWDEETDEIHFFCGNMYKDEYAEEVFPNEQELNTIYTEIVTNY